MKDETDRRSSIRKFEDEMAAIIDGAPNDLTIAEMIGVIEIQLHVLKCRFYPGRPKPDQI